MIEFSDEPFLPEGVKAVKANRMRDERYHEIYKQIVRSFSDEYMLTETAEEGEVCHEVTTKEYILLTFSYPRPIGPNALVHIAQKQMAINIEKLLAEISLHYMPLRKFRLDSAKVEIPFDHFSAELNIELEATVTTTEAM